MNKQLILGLLCMLCFTVLFGHEEHKSMEESKTPQESITPSSGQPTVKHFGSRPLTWTQWIGSFHLILLHFPIALINMLAISELLLAWLNRPIFDFSSRFLAVSSAIISPPTALLGLVYSYSASYQGLMEIFLWWHMWLGLLTAVFAVIVVLLRERIGIGKLYYGCLFLLFFLVNIAGFFGGGMTFGPYHMSPPL